MEEQRDEKLWELAKRRAQFQDALRGFLITIIILWGIWYLTAGRKGINTELPWPIWPTFFMGVFLFSKYIRAFKTDKDTLAEKEYEKLKNQQGR